MCRVNMRYYHKFALLGFFLSIVSIVFGIVGLLTPRWIRVVHDQSPDGIQYGLFQQCRENQSDLYRNCWKIEPYQIAQRIEISGYITLLIGLFASVFCTAFIERRILHFIPLVFILVSIILMYLGCALHVQHVIQLSMNSYNLEFQFGYSFFLMFVTCLCAIVVLAYFSFTTGFIYRHASSIFQILL